jgi:tripartite-type tricarboxylate transporter receptor subunit TctC
MHENGLNGYDVVGWTALVAPAGTPAPNLDRLSVESINIINAPEVKKRLYDWGLGALGLSRERSTQFIKAELVKWGEAVRVSGAKLE